MNIEQFFSPEIESLTDGYSLIRDFFTEDKKHHGIESILNIRNDGETCTLDIYVSYEHFYGNNFDFATEMPLGTIRLQFSKVNKCLNPGKNIEGHYMNDIYFNPIKDTKGNVTGVNFSLVNGYNGSPLFEVEAKSMRLLSFSREKVIPDDI